jgi:hypothetical protein
MKLERIKVPVWWLFTPKQKENFFHKKWIESTKKEIENLERI